MRINVTPPHKCVALVYVAAAVEVLAQPPLPQVEHIAAVVELVTQLMFGDMP